MKQFLKVLMIFCVMSIASGGSSAQSTDTSKKVNEPGVIMKTKKARYVGGNSKAFQKRHEAKMKRKLQKEKARAEFDNRKPQ